MALALIFLLCSCGNSVKNQAYIDKLKENGADSSMLDALIEYEKQNSSQPDGGYIDITGRTVMDIANERGITLEEYLAEYELPANMPGLVSETEASYTVPAGHMADMFDMSFETLKETFNLPDWVTAETTWGEAIGETTVGVYVGEDNVDSFKKEYKLDDNVNADTKWKEVREAVDRAKKEHRAKTKKLSLDFLNTMYYNMGCIIL